MTDAEPAFGRGAGELVDRVAIVTGGSGGIGRAIAAALARDGATVVIADRDIAGARGVAGRLTGAEARSVELEDPPACRALIADVANRYGRIDILVNGAGFQHIAPVTEFPLERWDAILRTMLTAPFLLIQAALPVMIAAGWGRIVNIGSIHSVVASPNKAAYVSAKHGLLGLTRTVAMEVGAHGITCNAVCPTYVRSPMVEAQIADQARTRGIPEREVVERVMLADSAIPRLIEVDEVAAYVRFLCSDAAGGITGSAQMIDGGWTAH